MHAACSEGEAADASERCIAFGLHRVTRRVAILVKNHRAARCGQRGGGATECDAGGDRLEADGQALLRGRAHRDKLAVNAQFAGERAQTGDGEHAAVDDHRLAGARILEQQIDAGAAGRRDGLVECLTHLVDGDACCGAQAGRAAKAAERGRAIGNQRIAALAHRIAAQNEAQRRTADRHVGSAAADGRADTAATDDDAWAEVGELTGKGESAAEAAKTIEAGEGGTGEGEFAISAEAGRAVAGEAQASDAAEFEQAGNRAAARAVSVESQAAGAARQAYKGRAGRQQHLRVGGSDVPEIIGAVVADLQITRDPVVAQGDTTRNRQREDLANLVQHKFAAAAEREAARTRPVQGRQADIACADHADGAVE